MNVHRPRSFDEALAVKARHPDAIPVAGGTDLWVHWPSNLDAHDRTYLDLDRVEDLHHLSETDDEVIIGARTTYWDVLQHRLCQDEFPMLLEAARQVGAIQIQSRGTWAGNIANASPAADGVPVLMAYDARVALASSRGSRQIPLHEFYVDYRKTVAAPDELIEAIHVPRRRYEVARFEKIGSRRAQTIAKVGAAVTHGGDVWRVVVASMAPVVKRCPTIEAVLTAADPLAGPDDLMPAIETDLSPIDDMRSSAAYRSTVLARVLYAIVTE